MADYSFVNQMSSAGGTNTQGLPTHEEYQNFIRRWKFLNASYLGGVQYKMGQYLTKYIFESDADYTNRIAQTPLDNHCKAVIHIYNSFLFRHEPDRKFGSMEGMPELEQFLKDADMDGRSWKSFIQDVNIQSSIYGHCCVLVDRPETQVGTRAEELQQGIRPYVTIYTPENILDWSFVRMPSGKYELQYVRFLEQEERSFQQDTSYYIRTWTRDEIILESYKPKKSKPIEIVERKANPLGKVPAVWVYANRSPIKGIGVSDIGDISDAQNFLYQLYSEAEQLIRLTNHPTLVKTAETQASAGAGAIIEMPADMDANLKPYILQPSGQNLQAILQTIDETIKAIDRMAHLGAVRAIETRQMSGVAMQSEFVLLDSKLNEKAKNLELAEEQIWRYFAEWQGMEFDGEIEYPKAFHFRDKSLDIDILKKAADCNPTDTRVRAAIDIKILDLLDLDEDELAAINDQRILDLDTVSEEANYDIVLPHEMTDPITGETRMVATQEEHIVLANQGWVHPVQEM
jgi:hypothetical protein